MHTQTRCPPFVVIVCTGWKKRHARQTTNDTFKRRVCVRTHWIRTHYVILPSRSDAILNWRTCTHVDTMCTDPTSFMIGQFEKSHVTHVSSTRVPAIKRVLRSTQAALSERVLSVVKFNLCRYNFIKWGNLSVNTSYHRLSRTCDAGTNNVRRLLW